MMTAGQLRSRTLAVDKSPVNVRSEVLVEVGGVTYPISRVSVRRTFKDTDKRDASGVLVREVDVETLVIEVAPVVTAAFRAAADLEAETRIPRKVAGRCEQPPPGGPTA